MRHRPRLLAAALTATAATVLAPAAAMAAPVSTAAPAALPALEASTCADVSVQRETFVRGGLPFVNWRENLAFDGRGRMWVSNNLKGQVEAYDATGARVTTFAAPLPGGLALAPSGRMEVNTGIVFGTGTISSFDPDATTPSLRTEVANLSGHNGLALDAEGNRYVTGEGAKTVRKYRADGTADSAWSAEAKASGTNGAYVDGSTLYVSRLSDVKSSIVAMGTDAAAPRTVAELSPFVIGWKGMDDLTVRGDDIYAAGFISGEVVRINKRTGASCTLVRGLGMPTSVRAPIAFGSTDPARDLFVTAADGSITRLTVTPR